MHSSLPLLVALLAQWTQLVPPKGVIKSAPWTQQLPVKEDVRSALLRRDYEVGVRYDDAPVAAVFNPCSADDFSVVFDWGEEEGPSPPSRRETPSAACSALVANPACVPPGGPYQLWSDHVYGRPGKYSVRIESRVHCFGVASGSVPYPASFMANVYGRIPLERIWLSPSAASVGETVGFRVQLRGFAPPSGTRVILRAIPATFIGVPPFVDVPPRASEHAVTFAISGPPGMMSIEATTIPNSPLRRSLKVRPKK